MSESSIAVIRETVTNHLHGLWVRCMNMKTAVEISKDLNAAKVCSPERLVEIAKKYGIMSMSATM